MEKDTKDLELQVEIIENEINGEKLYMLTNTKTDLLVHIVDSNPLD